MARGQKTLRGVSFLIADSNAYFSSMLFSMLKGFGADKILQARDASSANDAFNSSKVDVMLCDFTLAPDGGLTYVRNLRRDTNAPHRQIPILFTTSDTRISTIKAARDAGVNMIITKPLSPKGLYDRLVWVAYDDRDFIDTPTYCGPDRHVNSERIPDGKGRRKTDAPVVVEQSAGAGL
jgi:two-component system chemotaxis response regulator CheY